VIQANEQRLEMKRLVLIIIGAVVLTNCSSKTIYVTSTDALDTAVEVVETTESPIASETNAPRPMTDEELFLEYMYDDQSDYINQTPGTSESLMLETANMSCGGLRDGSLDMTELVDALVQSADTPESANFFAALIGGAVSLLCPDQMWQLEKLG
jgi:hypothetical protein